jgi:hypothetical protein
MAAELGLSKKIFLAWLRWLGAGGEAKEISLL